MKTEPIETAPRDGSQVTVNWTDRDGVENQSVARYRAMWGNDEGWWVALNGDTLKRIRPASWLNASQDEDD